ncbi:MAG: hypothetical protein HYU63_04315 [Armatimonadetes bacterium]|nr:hypothetical protein [Armatimonadota bacterium]
MAFLNKRESEEIKDIAKISSKPAFFNQDMDSVSIGDSKEINPQRGISKLSNLQGSLNKFNYWDNLEDKISLSLDAKALLEEEQKHKTNII